MDSLVHNSAIHSLAILGTAMECLKQQAGLPVPRIIAPDLHRIVPRVSPSSLEYVWNWTFEQGIAALNAHARCPESPHTSPRSRPVKKENDSIPTLQLPKRAPQGESLNTSHFEHVKRLCKGIYPFPPYNEASTLLVRFQMQNEMTESTPDQDSTSKHATNKTANGYARPRDFLTPDSPWFGVKSTTEDMEKRKDGVKQAGTEQSRAQMIPPMSDSGSLKLLPKRAPQIEGTSNMGGNLSCSSKVPTWKPEKDLSMAVPQLADHATGPSFQESPFYVPSAFRLSQSQEPSASPSSFLYSNPTTDSASPCSLDEEWEQDSSGNVARYPPLYDKHRLLVLLLERFHASNTANQHGVGSGSGRSSRGSYGSSHQTARQDKQTPSRKRKAGYRYDDDDIERGGYLFARPSKKPRGADGDAGDRLTFACPFSKRDPARHRRCYRYELSRIRDVKQHLRRCHRRAMYCPVCGQTFQDEEMRDVHVRRRTCQENPDLDIEGITETQRQQLAEKCSLKKPQEDQWFDVFDIVFPGQPRPKSPYVHRLLSEKLQSFRDFLTEEGPAILSEQLQQHRPWNEEDGHCLQELLGDGFERIAESWAQRLDDDGQHKLSDSSSEAASSFLAKNASDQRTTFQASTKSYQESKPEGAIGTPSSFHEQASMPRLLPATSQQQGHPNKSCQGAPASRYLSTNPGHSGIAGTSSPAFAAPHAAEGLLEAEMKLYSLDTLLQSSETLSPTEGLCYSTEPWGVGALAEGSLAGGLG